MKKNITINLFGALYAIDEDAYNLLERYLNNMKSYFATREGGDEIADDIEHRVAEHLWSLKEQGLEAIDLETVKTVISQIGTPGEMDGATVEQSEASAGDAGGTEAAATAAGPKEGTGATESRGAGQTEGGSSPLGQRMNRLSAFMHGRRFYRDGKDAIMGGVISGLCHYCEGNDPLVWRLLTVVLMGLLFMPVALLSGMSWSGVRDFCMLCCWWIPILYVAIWVLAPVARTTEEQMRMKGKAVTPESIKEETIKEMTDENAGTAPSQGVTPRGCLARLFEVAGRTLKLLLLIAFLIAALLSFFGVCASVAFCAGTTWFLELFGADPAYIHAYCAVPTFGYMLLALAVCLLVMTGIPFVLLLRAFMPGCRKPRMGTMLLCIVGFVSALVVSILLAVMMTETCRRIDDELYVQRNTRNGIYLSEWSWNLLDSQGWDVQKTGNVDPDLYDEIDDPLKKNEDFLDIKSSDSGKPMQCVLTKSEDLQAGTFALEGLLAADANDVDIIVTDVAGDTLATLSSPSATRSALSDMSWDMCREQPYFQQQNVDSVTWNDEVFGHDYGWMYFSTPSFHHNGGLLYCTLRVGKDSKTKYAPFCTRVSLARLNWRFL